MAAPRAEPNALSAEIAVFPLSGALLLPEGRLPLNIFEPRYLAMTEDSLAADPDDHAARIDLAVALNAMDQRDQAVDALLEAFKRDRAWNEEAARKQLLKFFEAWGFDDPATLAGRRKLSSLLFR